MLGDPGIQAPYIYVPLAAVQAERLDRLSIAARTAAENGDSTASSRLHL
jgi:hypothetical protein